MSRLGGLLLALAFALASPRPALAQAGDEPEGAATALPPVVREVDIDEQLGKSVDRQLRFTDPTGKPVTLSEVLEGGRPAILVLAYYECPMLCGLVLRGLVDGLKRLDLSLGDQYRVVTVSIDPRDRPDDAARKQASALAALGAPDKAAAWPFLVGKETDTRLLADAVGFRYAFDPRTGQYAHPAVLAVLTPDGHISRYLYGTTFSARDLRLALVEAGQGKTGTIIDRVLLTCYRYDPVSRRYGPYILGFIRIGAAGIFLAVLGMVAVLVRVDRRRRREDEAEAARAARIAIPAADLPLDAPRSPRAIPRGEAS